MTKITIPNVLAAVDAVKRLMKAGDLFHFEPMPNGQFEIATQRAAIKGIRELAALDDGHPIINWDALEPEPITGLRLCVPGADKLDAAGRLVVRGCRFTFDGLTDFEVEVAGLNSFDFVAVTMIHMTLGTVVTAGPRPRTVYIEEVVG